MPSSSSIRAGAAYVELSVSDAQLRKGLEAATRRLKAFGEGLKNLGADIQAAGLKITALGVGLVTPLLAAARSFSETGDRLDKLAARTGISVEALSELGYAAQLSGASLDDLEVGLRTMQRTLGYAKEGLATYTRALDKLGLTVDQLLTLSPEQQFELIAKRLQGISDPAIRAATAMEIFGRAGTTLLPMLGDIQALRTEARRLGLTISTEDARAAAVFNDSMDRLWATLQRVVFVVGGALAPLLTRWANQVSAIAVQVKTWLAQNQGLVVSLLKIGAVIVGTGGGLTALGGIISAVGTLFTAFATVAGTALGFILTPLGLVLTAIAGIGAYLVWSTGAGGQALKWLGDRFGDLKNFAIESFQGIKDALASGDIALAGKVLWLSLLVVWRAGVNTLKGWWLDFKEWFFQVSNNLFWGLVATVINVFYAIRRVWLTAVNFWSDLFGRFTNFFKNTWNEIVGWTAKQLAKVLGKLDSRINVDAVVKGIDQETQRQNTANDNSTLDARLNRAKELDDLEQDRQRSMAAAADIADAEDKKRKAQNDKERQDAQKELDKAKQAWRDALKEAHDKRAAAEAKPPVAGPPGPPEPPPVPDVGKVQDAVKAAMPQIAAQAKLSFDVAGTFNASAAGEMGVGTTAADRTAKATEETAKYSKKLWQQVTDNPPAFE
ncbi:MAG: hypothetical protein ACREJ2_03190 [Planctomycetota bacterium]